MHLIDVDNDSMTGDNIMVHLSHHKEISLGNDVYNLRVIFESNHLLMLLYNLHMGFIGTFTK